MHLIVPKIIRKQFIVRCYFKTLIRSTCAMEKNYSTTKSWRLSSQVQPRHYDLLLRPNLESGTFNGMVKINVKVKEPSDTLTLNTKYLDISKVEVNRGGESVPVSSFLEDKQSEQLRIGLTNILNTGEYQICVNFNGLLTRDIVGLYLSRLDSKRTMVASKFEPTYARQAFPCFDEPDFKATFDITLVKPQSPSYVALSNMNEISKTLEKDTGLEKVKFATSVPMSSYLAVFVICDFDFKETDINANGIGHDFKLRAFAQKNETHKIDYALDIGKRATEFYINYYEVPFPLPKLDMIAIPDYVSGATEHWGLITYRETQFLVDDATASAKNKIGVANTIAHELAHMWFGNLVTMKWWDELWLNEGFATYMQCKCLNAMEPSWTMLDQFLIKTLQPVLESDAKLSSHPIVQTVNTPDQITAIFDIIAYNKGASILRMLEGFAGEENFRKGVSDYLREHRFGNTVTQQLLASLEPYFSRDNPGLNLSYIMDTWTRQMGYPLLTVSPGPGPQTYVITQSRFLLDPQAVSPDDSTFKYRWYVPVTYKTNKGASQNTLWFPNSVENVKITLKSDETWLKVNNNQMGYYRVNYPDEMWDKLLQQLKGKSEQLSISDRSHLLDDVFALAAASSTSYATALDLTTYLSEETEYVPWETARYIFSDLYQKLLHSSASEKLQTYVQRLVTPLYEKQSWEKNDGSVINRLLRTTILSLAAKFEHPDALSKIKTLFVSWLNDRGSNIDTVIDPDVRDLVYYYGMKSATQTEWEKLWKVYQTESDVQELSKLRSALAAPRDVEILKKYIVLAFDERYIRSQDYFTVLLQISGNPSGTLLVWDDVRNRWPQLVDRFTLNSRYLGALIPGITKSFNTEAHLKQMEDFFSQYKEAGAGETGRKQALENVRNNIKWSANFEQPITSWLEAQCDKEL